MTVVRKKNLPLLQASFLSVKNAERKRRKNAVVNTIDNKKESTFGLLS
jgi:hypothetical protein